ncbi:MAG: hypothetical protein ACBR23_16770 [Microcoleus sp.]|uniref:hypothetical protein n=1 Tax=Microcoleus sp. TaxID=44472 RepID=UPI0035232163
MLTTFRLVVQTQKFLLIDERAIALWDSGWERRSPLLVILGEKGDRTLENKGIALWKAAIKADKSRSSFDKSS